MAVSGNTGLFNSVQGNYIMRVDWDGSGNAIYQGWAIPGTATSDALWRIVKNTYNGSNQFTNNGFPNGSPSFTFSWDFRTNYTYS